VTKGGAPVRSPEDARYFGAWIARVSAAALAHQGWNTAAERQEVVALLERARAVFDERAAPTGRER
jgi:hypothetical protein